MSESAAINPVVAGLIAPPHEADELFTIDLGKGVELKAKWLTSANLVSIISEKVEKRKDMMRMKKALRCKDVDGSVIEVQATDDVIGTATLMEHLIVDPPFSFSDAILLAERNLKAFAKINEAFDKMAQEEVETAKND